MRELFIGASWDRLRLRLPHPEPSPVGLAHAGFPFQRGRRFFLGLGEEGGGPIYPSGSRLVVGPQRRTASPKPCMPIEEVLLTSLANIQERSLTSMAKIQAHDLRPPERHVKVMLELAHRMAENESTVEKHGMFGRMLG
jgi:hypothetical protein